MSYTNLSYRCYILPFLASIYYYILSSKSIDNFFNYHIPDDNFVLINLLYCDIFIDVL